MRIGLVQLSVGPQPKDNLPTTIEFIRNCVADGAAWVFTPEVTNLLETNRANQERVLTKEKDDETLNALRDLARVEGIWITIGSLCLKSEGADARFSNRSFLISPQGEIAARYDKIHMFDVDLSQTERFRESDRYAPGSRAVVVDGPVRTGLSICYDLRFPYLFRDLAKAGAAIISVPSAFAKRTGAAHWHVLLRARAIETGCFVVAAAQTGVHGEDLNAMRETYGHSLVVNPWGEVLLDMGQTPGYAVMDINLDEVSEMRRKIPSLYADQSYAKE